MSKTVSKSGNKSKDLKRIVYKYTKAPPNQSPKVQPPAKSKTRKSITMPRQRSRRRRGNRVPRRTRSRVPPSMRPTLLSIRRVVPYSATLGTEHRWYFKFDLANVVKPYYNTYAEFKPISLSVRYISSNPPDETGLYAGILLDQDGFGTFGASSGISWFPTLGAMNGVQIRKRSQSSNYRWIPTEPAAREWRTVYTTKEVPYTFASIYFCNNGKEGVELGGAMEVRAKVLARGLYYNAAVSLLQSPHLEQFSECLHPPDADISDVTDRLQDDFHVVD